MEPNKGVNHPYTSLIDKVVQGRENSKMMNCGKPV